MTLGLELLLTLALLGFIAMYLGVIYSNHAVQEMRAALNQEREPHDQIKWHNSIQYAAQKVIDSYGQSFPNGPFSRKLKIGYYIAGVGGVVMIASAFLMKFTN